MMNTELKVLLFLLWNFISKFASIYLKMHLMQCNEMHIFRQIAVSFDQDQRFLFQRIHSVIKVQSWEFLQLHDDFASSQKCEA